MRALSSTKLFVSWAGLALVVGAVGCGGSTDDDTQTGGRGGSGATGGSGGSGGSSTGGAGGTGGGTGGSGGTGGTVSPDAGEIVCNGVICRPTSFGDASVAACCTTQNACGVLAGSTCFPSGGGIPEAGSRGDGAGVPDPSCASLTLAAGITLPGCCMPDNNCGFSSQIAGCVSLETLRQLGLPGINLPDGGPMSCVYPPP